jgi:hypothetical protein
VEEEPSVEWSGLSARAREALEWAAASEVERVVGTRGILFGVSRAAPGAEVDDLLAYFGLRSNDLLGALQQVRSAVRFDPDISSPEPLDGLPRMTENAEEVLTHALELAEAAVEPIDTPHLLGGVLEVSQGTAYTALSNLLGNRASLPSLTALYLEYLPRRHELQFASFLAERLGQTQSSSAATPSSSAADESSSVAGSTGLTPTVERAAGALTGEVTASAFAAEILRLHPEYGNKRAAQLELDTTSGRTAPATTWLSEIRALLPASMALELHGRLVIAGLARLDDVLRQQLTSTGFLEALESEFEEPVSSLFLDPPPDAAQTTAPALLPLTHEARQALTYARSILASGNPDVPVDAAHAGAALILGGLLVTIGTGHDAGPLRVQIAAAASEIGYPNAQLANLTAIDDATIAASEVSSVVVAADALARAARATTIELRQLAAAATEDPAPGVVAPALQVLDAAMDLLSDTWRAYWEQVLSGSPDFALAGGTSSDAVDPTRGIPLDRDHLNVRTYVAMLGTVVADTRTPMPLSIGLFGEWGAGKSYFMGLLRQQINELSQSPSTQYHRNIAQIGFNAWHYADTNLWASLGDEIFEQLTNPKMLSDGTQPDAAARLREETGARLREELADKRQLRKELDAATDQAKAETVRLTQAVEQAAADRRVSARDLASAVSESGAVKEELGRAWDVLGVEDEAEQGRLLRAELSGTATEVSALRQIATTRRGLEAIAVAALFLIAVVVLAYAAPQVRGLAVGGGLASVLAAAVAWVAWVRRGVSALGTAARKINDSLNDAANADVKEKLDALRAAEARESVLEAQRAEVIQKVGELGRELAELTPGQRLYRFVSDRASSEDYRRHLGLISTVRKDFEQLIELMAEWRKRTPTPGETAPIPIDRIVLYIDDLDRCSPRQVVDVLQAVHLLLALELFVVVVGVDPRWLVQSLQSEYDKLLTNGAEGELGPASPRDYLEKIFNIPFALPRMSPASFRLLLNSFAAGEEEQQTDVPTDGTPATDTPSEGEETAPAATASPPTTSDAPSPALPPKIADEQSEVAAVAAGAPPLEVRPLSTNELSLMAALAPLVETPRQAKRLLNLYRMVRSTRDLRPASVFLGGEGRPGEYEAVVLLLGLLTGHPALLEDVLAAPSGDKGTAGGLMRRDPKISWSTFAADLAPRPRTKARGGGWQNPVIGEIAEDALADWQKLDAGLARATPIVTLPDLSAFQLWAPRIARFSFQVSPFVSAWEGQERDEEAAQAPAVTS